MDESSVDIQIPSVRLSALANALLDSENQSGNTMFTKQYHDDPEYPSKSYIRNDAGKRSKQGLGLYEQLSQMGSSGPRRIVRIKSKRPAISSSSPHSVNKPALSNGRSSKDFITPASTLHSLEVEESSLGSSTWGSTKTLFVGSGGVSAGVKNDEDAVARDRSQNARQDVDFNKPGTSSIIRTVRIAGSSLRGPARRFRKRTGEDFSPNHEQLNVPDSRPLEAVDENGAMSLEYRGGNRKQLPTRKNDKLNESRDVSPRRLTSRLPPSEGKENEELRSLPTTKAPKLIWEIPRENREIIDPVNITPQHNERKPLAVRETNIPHKPAPPPPKMAVLDMATANAGASTTTTTTSKEKRRNTQLTVNGKTYQILKCIGRGGSCKVYRVMSENSNTMALKKVSFAGVYDHLARGFKAEIELLEKLSKVDRVVKLLDAEVNERKQTLSVLMELGEADFHTILNRRLNDEDSKFDITFTQFYWKEMLECVVAVHHYDIVHSDLKPANFLLVTGRLKLIDFGIANAIPDDTVNIQRGSTVGTPNFVSPEALLFIQGEDDQGGNEVYKSGKPSDIWSLGCILYKMVYGKPPFEHQTTQLQKALAILDENHIIAYPSHGVGGVKVPDRFIKTMKACLTRDQFQRPTAEELLAEADQLSNPDPSTRDTIEMREEDLASILHNLVDHCRISGVPTDSQVDRWQKLLFEQLRETQG